MQSKNNLSRQSQQSSGFSSPAKGFYEFPKQKSTNSRKDISDRLEMMMNRSDHQMPAIIPTRGIAQYGIVAGLPNFDNGLALPPLGSLPQSGNYPGGPVNEVGKVKRENAVKLEELSQTGGADLHSYARFLDKIENESISRGSANHMRGNGSIAGSMRSQHYGFKYTSASLLGDPEFEDLSKFKVGASSVNNDPVPSLGKRYSKVLTFKEEGDEDEQPVPPPTKKRKPSEPKLGVFSDQAKNIEQGPPNSGGNPHEAPQMTYNEMLDRMFHSQEQTMKLEEADIQCEDTAHPTVVDNFKKQLRSKMVFPSQEYHITEFYYKRIQTLLRLGDLELTIASLVVDQLSWQKFSEADTSLFNIADLREVYLHFFGGKPEPQDLNIFYQLFFTMIFSKKHLNNLLMIHVESETLERRFYTQFYNTYKVWQQFLQLEADSLSPRKVNERFNRLKRPAVEGGKRGDLQAVLDLVFAPGKGDGASETPAVYMRTPGVRTMRRQRTRA